MKALKRLGCVLLAVLLLMSLGAPAFADEGSNLLVLRDERPGRDYAVYQIFKGTAGRSEETKDVLADAEWGASVLVTDGKLDGKTLEQWMDDIASAGYMVAEGKSVTGNEKDARELAAQLLGRVKEESFAKLTWNEAGKHYQANLDDGYYLIVDETGDEANYTVYLVGVLGQKPMVVEPKLPDIPEVEKQVKDRNDSFDEESEWQKSADYDVDDTIPFLLTAKIPEGYELYYRYKLAFHDEMDAGLKLDPDSIKVSLVNGGVSDPLDGDWTKNTTDQSFDIVFANLKENDAIVAGSVIQVEYTAKLTEQAVIGQPNVNKVKLEYSRDPNYQGDGEDEPTSETGPKTAVVFTYKTTVNKVDGSEMPDENGQLKPLAGAEFTLYKLMKTGEASKWEPIESIKNTEGTVFTFERLDDGVYRLEETQVPEGYNKCDDIYFQVTAEHTETASTLKVTQMVLNEQKTELVPFDVLNGDDAMELTFSQEALNEGNIMTDVQNLRGLVLPETGGIGTTIFYVVGGILVAAALVLLITKKRMSKEG